MYRYHRLTNSKYLVFIVIVRQV